MRKYGFKKLFGGIFLIVFTLLSVSIIGRISANAFSDGTYTISVSAINKDTGGSSAAGAYLSKTANLFVSGGTYEVSVPVSSVGQEALKSASVEGKSILEGPNLVFTLTTEEAQVLVDYHIVTDMIIPNAKPFHIDKSPSAYEKFDWSSVQPVRGSSSSSSSSSISSSSSSSISNSTSSSSQSLSSQSIINPGSSEITKMNYSILQSDKKSISTANQYYSHVADVEKLSDGSYKVTMHVQYGKSSGMSAKGFVPLTVNGQKVTGVTYGSTDNNYTASFSFNVPSLDALTKAPVKGTIHVSVPTMDISSDFDIFYNFTGATTSDGTGTTNANNSSAAETPSNSSQTSAKASTTKKAAGKLPQTNDIQNATIAIVGVISLIMIVTTAVYRRNRV